MCIHQLRIQGKAEEAIFYGELQQVFDHLPIDHIKLCYEHKTAALKVMNTPGPVLMGRHIMTLITS